MVALRDGDGSLIGYYEKHEYRNRETAKPYQFRNNINIPHFEQLVEKYVNVRTKHGPGFKARGYCTIYH